MRAVSSLPDGYGEICSIDLQKDRKLAVLVNALALVIAAVMVLVAAMYKPLSTVIDMGIHELPLKLVVMGGGMLAYMCLHELVHGMTMKACGTRRVRYGFTGMYFFAGSDDYYGKGSYIAIALAPVVVFLIVLMAINMAVSEGWFWVVYLVQVINVSGAAGDMYVVARFAGLPRDIVVRDSGVSMTVYSKRAIHDAK